MTTDKPFFGTYTALVTPFVNGEVDLVSLEKLVRHQVANGIDGFIVNGTTGESPTLTKKEVQLIYGLVRENTEAKHQVILGIGTNNTQTTVERAREANALKADGVLAVVPYYNKPPQEGLVKHFEAVADSSEVPVILYNVPGRTIQSLSVESIAKLAKHEMIQGIKESTGNLGLLKEIMEVTPKSFSLLSGDDGTAVDFCFQGGDGLVGVITHVIPKEMVELIKAAREKVPGGREKFAKYENLLKWLYCESNPIPVKKALHLMGLLRTAEMRLPLVELGLENTEALKACLPKL